jgi:ferredoxin
MSSKRVVLHFPSTRVEEPIIYNLIKDYGLVVNILRASIDLGKTGQMVVELSGDANQLSRAFTYLEQLDVTIEPLNRRIRLLEERCVSCTACVPHCPTAALRVDRETWKVSYQADDCVVCLSCVEVCPYRAVEVDLAA